MHPGRLALNAGELLDANVNRSPTAYEANPAGERAHYRHDTDKRMVQLGLLGSDGRFGISHASMAGSRSEQDPGQGQGGGPDHGLGRGL
jgi:neutral ceramidase